MNLTTFLLEHYYGEHEFTTPYMLSSSDPESWSLQELLEMATPEIRMLWETQRFGYTEVKGSHQLRAIIAKSLYPGLTADNILCFAGAEEGIFCSLLTLCGPQDHAIIVRPCYQSLYEIPRFTHCALTTVDLQPEHAWGLDINAIEKAIQHNTKIIVINFPHNPTGCVLAKEVLEKLLAVAAERNIMVFSDEVYRFLGNPVGGWVQPAALLYDNAVSLGVMSKAYGLPGLRIGWIACRNKEVLERIGKTKLYTSLCSSGPSEILSMIALLNKETILQRNNQIVEHNLLLLDQFLKKHADLFSWVRPQGGCTGLVAYHGTMSIEAFCEQVRKKAGILLLPGSVYGIKNPCFRMGFGRKNMPEVLSLFEAFLAAHKERV